MTRGPVAVAGGAVARANAQRNLAGVGSGRRRRWRQTRAALSQFLEVHVPGGAAVAVVGAGNGHDLPVRQLARLAGRLDLIDLDARALAAARRRAGPWAGRVGVLPGDVTGGEADRLVASALGAGPAERRALPELGDGRYDVVIADLMLTQLLYPALLDAGVARPARDALLRGAGQDLTNRVVARLHDAAPEGAVIIVHDVLGWWPGHPQPFALDAVLALEDPAEAAALVATGATPRGCDELTATAAAGASVVDVGYWSWPFSPGTDYLVRATAAVREDSSHRPDDGGAPR